MRWFPRSEGRFFLSKERLDSSFPWEKGVVTVDPRWQLLHVFSFHCLYRHVLYFLNPSFPYLLSLISCIFCARSEYIHVVSCVHHSRFITVTMDALSEAMARKFTLTSKEDRDVAVGEEAATENPTAMTFDLVGRVVSEKIYSTHTLQLNIERLLRSVHGF